MNRLCHNSHYPLPRYGQYCSHCGQKYTDGRITLGELLHDFITNVLNIDNKLWQTWRAMWIPGKLTRAYFIGRQARYVAPLRLFFFSSVILFAVIGFVGLEEMQEDISQGIRENEKETYYGAFLDQLKTATDTLQREMPTDSVVLDSLYSRMYRGHSDSTNLGLEINIGPNNHFGLVRVANADLATMNTDELLDKYQVTDYWQRLHLRQYIRLTREGADFTGFIMGKMVWMLLLLMPALAFVLKLLYIRRSFYFVEHLVYLFHIHAFAFLTLVLMLLINYYSPEDAGFLPVMYTVGLLGIYLYFYLAQRRVYRQGWFKTLVKYGIFQFFYLGLLIFFMVLTFVATALTY